MIKKPSRSIARKKRQLRIRNKIEGVASKPRLSIFRSNMHMYAQIIDDKLGHTIVSASTEQKEIAKSLQKTNNLDAAKAIGQLIAKRALEKGIEEIVFDRSGYIYQGKVQALAEAAREAGLKF